MDGFNGINRCLFPGNFQKLTKSCLAVIKTLDNDFDEIIIAVTEAEHGYTTEAPFSSGERVAKLSAVLRNLLNKPFYILPVKQNGLSEIQVIHRIKVTAPSFETVICTSAEEEVLYQKVLACETRRVELLEEEESIYKDVKDVKRGLFLTRAQFFHNGHAAFIEQMLKEVEEIIVIVAKADCSHTLENPATCGERLEMINPYLEKVAPKRFFLGAAPYEQYIAVNFYELLMMFPKFDCVYSSNPAINELAGSTGLKCVGLNTEISTSASYIRERIIQGKSYAHLLPREVAAVLECSPALRRLIALSKPEKRGLLCVE